MNENDFATKLLDLGVESPTLAKVMAIAECMPDPDDARASFWQLTQEVRRMVGLFVLENAKELMDKYKDEWRTHHRSPT